MITINPIVTVGNILTAGAMLLSGLAWIMALHFTVRDLKRRYHELRDELGGLAQMVGECREHLRRYSHGKGEQ